VGLWSTVCFWNDALLTLLTFPFRPERRDGEKHDGSNSTQPTSVVDQIVLAQEVSADLAVPPAPTAASGHGRSHLQLE
jgi:hypothetical protein